VAYLSDLTDSQWNLLEPLLLAPSKRGPKHGDDLRHVVDAMLYISHTGCQWRFLPEQFGPWTRVWSQFRRWSRNGTWTRILTALHASSRTALGRKEPLPSMVVIDTHPWDLGGTFLCDHLVYAVPDVTFHFEPVHTLTLELELELRPLFI
jgi:putative transposase